MTQIIVFGVVQTALTTPQKYIPPPLYIYWYYIDQMFLVLKFPPLFVVAITPLYKHQKTDCA